MSETPAPYGSMPQSDFDAQYARLFEAAGCRTQAALATLLEVHQSSVSDAKRRQSVPPDWLVTLFEKKQINPHWIRTGLGGKIVAIHDATTHIPPAGCTVRTPLEACTTDELFAEIMRRAQMAMGA